ncbi:DNA polymerase III subunit delta' [Rhodobacteraceae bacterium]|nr:DNA polymerase III subunit delta' [Paracoccaceae bacterium]
MSDDELPEADRAEGAPHPRETTQFFGHEAIEADVATALSGERMHHAWLLTGPKGIGKATLAWRMARFLMAAEPAVAGMFGDLPAEPPSRLDIDPDHPVLRRIAALSDPRCLSIRRAWDHDRKRLKTQITVEEVRKLNTFFGLSATDGGHRVVIVDSADEMNPSAANALLKVLEEPPKGAVLILISHQPARLLPTIRSRCRVLRMSELAPDAMENALTAAQIDFGSNPALVELANGSVGSAIRLQSESGLKLYANIMQVIGTAPSMDRQRLAKLVDHIAARSADTRLELSVNLLDLALTRMARAAAGVFPKAEACAGETEVLTRLASGPGRAQLWASLQQKLSARITHGRGVNIDAASLMTDAFLQINEAAR